MAQMKALTLNVCISDQNFWKIAVFMQTLGVPYKVQFDEVKVPSTLQDPNNSDMNVHGADDVLEYLQKQYDKHTKFTGLNALEEADLLVWIFFQVSGFEPSQLQVERFLEWGLTIPPTIKSYAAEVQRMYGMLGGKLRGKGFLKFL